MDEDRNEIERVARILMENQAVESRPETMSPEALRHLLTKMHSPRHTKRAIFWTMSSKTGAINSYEGDPLSGIGGAREASFSPNGFWIPNINLFTINRYILQGREIVPSASVINAVKKKLGIESSQDVIIE